MGFPGYRDQSALRKVVKVSSIFRCLFNHVEARNFLCNCLLLCLLLVCWVRENFSGGLGHIFPVWDSAVWSAGPVQFIWVLAWSGWRDCTGFLFSGFVVVGTVRLKWWGGGMAFFSFFLFCCWLSWCTVACGRI